MAEADLPLRSSSINYRAPRSVPLLVLHMKTCVCFPRISCKAPPSYAHACRVSLTLADFDIVRRIGDGSFSEVMQVRPMHSLCLGNAGCALTRALSGERQSLPRRRAHDDDAHGGTQSWAGAAQEDGHRVRAEDGGQAPDRAPPHGGPHQDGAQHPGRLRLPRHRTPVLHLPGALPFWAVWYMWLRLLGLRTLLLCDLQQLQSHLLRDCTFSNRVQASDSCCSLQDEASLYLGLELCPNGTFWQCSALLSRDLTRSVEVPWRHIAAAAAATAAAAAALRRVRN